MYYVHYVITNLTENQTQTQVRLPPHSSLKKKNLLTRPKATDTKSIVDLRPQAKRRSEPGSIYTDLDMSVDFCEHYREGLWLTLQKGIII